MKQENSSGGIGLLSLVFIVFLVLKLIGIINWSWWWVTAPLWIPFSIAIVAILIYALVLFIKYLILKRSNKRNKWKIIN
jgi:phosphoglycerol transferase MdoB-like AlkP superfamily enzyme